MITPLKYGARIDACLKLERYVCVRVSIWFATLARLAALALVIENTSLEVAYDGSYVFKNPAQAHT